MTDSTQITIRSNETAAEEIASAMRRKWGYDLRHPEGVRWLARIVGEVRAEVLDPSRPEHVVLAQWSDDRGR